MARKTVSIKDKRAEAEAAEAQEKTTKKAKKKAKRKSRAKKAPADLRMKMYWGVFNQSMRRVALYEFNQKKQAQQKAEELSKGGKSPHFIQKVKEEVPVE